VGIDHGRANVFVAEKLLHGTNIVAVFDEMGGEGVAEGVAGASFGEAGLGNGSFDTK